VYSNSIVLPYSLKSSENGVRLITARASPFNLKHWSPFASVTQPLELQLKPVNVVL
jgi:hypothetical protein